MYNVGSLTFFLAFSLIKSVKWDNGRLTGSAIKYIQMIFEAVGMANSFLTRELRTHLLPFVPAIYDQNWLFCSIRPKTDFFKHIFMCDFQQI